jgi:hypothetical protein
VNVQSEGENMPYGFVSDDTRTYIMNRAEQSNVSEKVKLESEAEDAYQVSVIFEGALDEEFAVDQPYAVNICDWIGELLFETCDTPFWEVILSDCNGEKVYGISGDRDGSWPYEDDPRD